MTLRRLLLCVVVGTATATATLIASLVAVALFPLVLVVLLASLGVAIAWWGVAHLRGDPRRLLGAIAVCLGPVLVLGALGVVLALLPASASERGHSARVDVSHKAVVRSVSPSTIP